MAPVLEWCSFTISFVTRGGGGVGRLLESLLRDPQDVLRKKSAQSCRLAFRAREVHDREACTALSFLSVSSSFSLSKVWIPCHPSALCHRLGIYMQPTTSDMDQICCCEEKVETQKDERFSSPSDQTRLQREKVSVIAVVYAIACHRTQAVWVFPVAGRQEALSFVRFHCLCLWFLCELSANVFLLS